MHMQAIKNTLLHDLTDLQIEYASSAIYTVGRVNQRGIDNAHFACVLLNQVKQIIEDRL